MHNINQDVIQGERGIPPPPPLKCCIHVLVVWLGVYSWGIEIIVDYFLAKFSGYFSYFPLYFKILYDTLFMLSVIRHRDKMFEATVQNTSLRYLSQASSDWR